MGMEVTKTSEKTGLAALSSQEQKEHRLKIGVRCRAFLDNFYVESRNAAVMAVDVDLWVTALQEFSHSDIMAAFSDYFDTGPRTKSGKLTKPDPGAIKQRLRKASTSMAFNKIMCQKCGEPNIVSRDDGSPSCYKCSAVMVPSQGKPVGQQK